MKIIIKYIICKILSSLKYFPLKKEYIIIQSFSPNIYSDNSRYLYEYLSKKKMKIFWYTKNSDIEKLLIKKKFFFINNKNIFKTIWITLKTKIVIDTGSGYYNFLGLISNESIKICLGHGVGTKLIKFRYIGTNKFETYNKFDFVNFTSDFAVNKIAKENYNLNNSKIIKFGYPRVEILKEKTNGKQMLEYLLGRKYKNEKILYYTPTWRPYNYSLPILKLKKFNFKKFNVFLKNNNILFFYTINTANAPSDLNNKRYSNIIYIDRNKKPFFDTTLFLKEIDILINDCSTTTTECSVLKKCQIHIFPDLENYTKKVGFLIDYKKNLAGPLCSNFYDLKKKILTYLINPKSYTKRYDRINKNNLKIFYDMLSWNSNYLFYKFIKKKLNS